MVLVVVVDEEGKAYIMWQARFYCESNSESRVVTDDSESARLLLHLHFFHYVYPLSFSN
jgi:hypothetical protein